MQKQQNILFYDGECGVCNTFVDFLLKHDKKEVLLFAPLQGITAKQCILTEILNSIDSVVFIDVDKKVYIKSTAALKSLVLLGGVHRLAGIFLLVPVFIRNAVYDLVARNRHKWFGKNISCRILSESEKQRFLP